MTRLVKWACGLALAVLVGTAVALQVVRDQRFPQAPVDERLLYVTSGELARRLALSHDALAADVYWMRALQHFGGELRNEGERRYDLLYPLLDLTTSLDPYFTLAYRFGAIFLMEPFPGGAGRPDLAIKLLEKGVELTPERWEYYLDIGFVYYWQLRDYEQAAHWFERGGELPNGPWWLRTYAAVMLTKGGDREASRFFWRNLRDSAEHEWLRENAEWRLLQLDALDQIDRLRPVVAEYLDRHGELPGTWADLVGDGLLPGIPVDPAGDPYVLDPATGQIQVPQGSRLYPLPVEPPPVVPDAVDPGPIES